MPLTLLDFGLEICDSVCTLSIDLHTSSISTCILGASQSCYLELFLLEGLDCDLHGKSVWQGPIVQAYASGAIGEFILTCIMILRGINYIARRHFTQGVSEGFLGAVGNTPLVCLFYFMRK